MTLREKYKTVFRAAWAERDRMAPEQRLQSELEFLPAALELMETPPSHTARWILWGTIAFVVIALLWAIFGQLDIIAVAQGKIVPSGQVKVVQPYERAVVKRLLVRDGMQVKKGQLLIELDATELGAEQQKAHSSLVDATLAAARARSLLEAVQRKALTARPIPASTRLPAANLMEANRLLTSEFQAFRSQLLASEAEALHLQAQQATTQETLNKLQALYPLHEQRASDLKRLLEKNYVPRHDYLEAENRRTETAKEIDVQRKRLLETDSLVARQREQREAMVAGFVRQTREQLVQAEQQLAQWQQEGIKLQSRSELLELRAPVDGTVQQLAVHTEGGVVTEAQPLLVIVPANERLEIEAMLENKDIGFVSKGQVAEVKVEAFPFTRYGIMEGKVLNVSLDAVADEKRGLLYQTRVLMDQAWIGVEGKRVPLVPGMAVTVEIKTGTRRVIDYFMSPVLQYGSESVRER
ncbi:MAG: HlyD family type secretion periplasmic adaptor subunit [Moraxellaceae bacterium]|jgi:hemolysin D|nr:HlyD family type secretion periplasmic adaptor subunit [Moraxellaceae bacterium]